MVVLQINWLFLKHLLGVSPPSVAGLSPFGHQRLRGWLHQFWRLINTSYLLTKMKSCLLIITLAKQIMDKMKRNSLLWMHK